MSGASSRARRLEELLDLALDVAPEARDAALDQACEGDPSLRSEVQALVVALHRAADFMDEPAGRVLGIAAPASRDTSLLGALVGPWRVEREIGRGGMGVVYLAERADGGFRQRVALKLVRNAAQSADIMSRFIAERQILAGLQHPNLARLVDGGALADGAPWFGMEYVDGVPITTWCDERQLGVRQRLTIFEQVAGAVQYAHQNLVVHRDIKPSNILVTADGTAKLLDFGIAKVLAGHEMAGAGQTVTGLWMLTPDYAAPEQVRGETITTATDIYALGAVLYELLCGHRAHEFERLTPGELERVICHVEPPRASVAAGQPVVRGSAETVGAGEIARRRASHPGRLQRLLAGDLDTILSRALHKDPAQRYSSVEAFLEDLHRYRGGLPVLARRDSLRYRLRKFVRRNVVTVSATAVVVVALVAGLAGTLWQARVARDEAVKARETRDFVIGLFRSANPDESVGRETLARDLIDRGLRRVDSSLGNQPGVQQELLGVLGVTYRELGMIPEATAALRRAVTIAEKSRGRRGAEELAARLTDLATVLNLAGDYAGADSLLRRALSIQQGSAKLRQSPGHVATLSEVANNLEDMGDWTRAESLHREVLALDEARFGAQSLSVATDLANLGVTLDQLNQDHGADSVYRRALAIRQAALPSDHPRVLTLLGNMAVTWGKLGRVAQAESLNREVLARRRRVLPPGHPDVAYSLHSLASNLEDQGRLTEAEPLGREALAIRRKVLGADHPVTLQTANNLAVLLVRIGAFDSAATVFREIVERWSVIYGPRDPRTATAINNLGVARAYAGDLREAERLVRDALALRRAALGDSAVDVGASRRNLAMILGRTGRNAEAEQQVREAITIFGVALLSDHPRLAEAQSTLGEVLLHTGRVSEADSVLRAARAIQESQLPGFDYRRAETAHLLARAKVRLREWAAAESLLMESAEVYRRFPGHRSRAAAVLVDLERVRRPRRDSRQGPAPR
ncbi:MAG: serine/threonine protein kinase [Gemmatimonadaceae bacterium]|nr:serine/threonine protein kinase [Gemmatimonadaceae bacterium]